MSDTVESLDEELQRQKRVNDKLLALLAKIDAVFPGESRITQSIDELKRTKEVLDDCQTMIDEKRRP